jgi:ribonucleoside-diphosphate reductase subunit M1
LQRKFCNHLFKVENFKYYFVNLLLDLTQLNLQCPGAIAVYLEPWHADVFDFVQSKLYFGKDEEQLNNLSLGLWIPDLFMRRVETDGMWSLMSPDLCPGLSDVWGDAFDKLYEK